MKKVIIQFGGTGDLAQKKLYPAYNNLLKKGFDFSIIALGRRYDTREEFLADILPLADPGFKACIDYLSYDMDSIQSAEILIQKINTLIGQDCSVEIIYYIALQPSLYESAIQHIQTIDSQVACSIEKKVIIEKPFGFDHDSAQRYNTVLTHAFSDKEIYRVDHYLGKDFMQNILIMRFHNDIIRNVWNNRSIESIQIIFDETHGVDQRLGFYERIGVVRDTIQNHILQIVTHLTMGEPDGFTPEEIAHEKVKVLRAIRPITEFNLSKYSSLGKEANHPVSTPTYAALKLFVDTYDFSGIPIYIRTGKMQKEAKAIIYIQFKNFTESISRDEKISDNFMIITTNPELKFDLSLNMKRPESSWSSEPVLFNFNHTRTFGINSPEAYEQIIKKILVSDKSLFPSMEEIALSWKVVEPMLSGNEIEVYQDRTLPESAKTLIEKDGRSWFN